MDAVLYGTRATEKDQVLKDLDEYCALDTLAMVEIYQHLQEVSGGGDVVATKPLAEPEQIGMF